MTLEQILLRIECMSAHDEDLSFLCNEMRAGRYGARKQVAAMALTLCKGKLSMNERRELWRWGRADAFSRCPELRSLSK